MRSPARRFFHSGEQQRVGGFFQRLGGRVGAVVMAKDFLSTGPPIHPIRGSAWPLRRMVLPIPEVRAPVDIDAGGDKLLERSLLGLQQPVHVPDLELYALAVVVAPDF